MSIREIPALFLRQVQGEHSSRQLLPVSVKFYAWASDDQMPLRKITVDFNDGPIVPGEGKFQNHKPRCQRSEKEPLGLCDKGGAGVFDGYACSADSDECSHISANNEKMNCVKGKYCDFAHDGNADEACLSDRFGDTSQACLEGYFQYNHTYSCDKSSATEIAPNGEFACKFEIGVQAKDNWGWCNGDNVGQWGPSVDGKSGAYELNCDIIAKPQTAEYYDGFIYMIP